MTNEQARREFAERLAYWNSTYVPDSVQTYLQAMKLAIRALQQVNEIRGIAMETTENFDTEDPVEAIKRIREVLHG